MSEHHKPKICPLLPVGKDGEPRPCLQHDCMFWTRVYTIERLPNEGCIRVFAPEMVDGLLRV